MAVSGIISFLLLFCGGFSETQGGINWADGSFHSVIDEGLCHGFGVVGSFCGCIMLQCEFMFGEFWFASIEHLSGRISSDDILNISLKPTCYPEGLNIIYKYHELRRIKFVSTSKMSDLNQYIKGVIGHRITLRKTSNLGVPFKLGGYIVLDIEFGDNTRNRISMKWL